MIKNTQIKKDLASGVLFIIFLCIIALRLSFTENSAIESFSLEGIFYDNFLSICISCILLLSSVIWFVVLLRRRNHSYKHTGIEYGVFLFVIAAAVSTYFASNRRAAMNDSLTLLAVIISAIAMVQLLDRQTRRSTLLFVIIAIGVANVYQCLDQFISGNKMMIDQYKNEPEYQLQRLGIESGSFQQMLYEHRLYSSDTKGYFSTSNSAGCFFNLAIFSALAVFGPGLKQFRKKPLKTFVLPIVILLVLFFGLLLTASKGALLAFILASFVLLISSLFAKFLKAHKFSIFSAAVAASIAAVLVIISYGLKHNTLPGGNSMLVRWQYWVASAAMITDHFFTGVGGSNFGSFYTHYKIPEALETVRDPHCFVLSIMSSYGIIGLTGFCCALFVPIIRALKSPEIKPLTDKDDISATVRICGVSAVLVLLFLRPLAVRTELADEIAVTVYIFAVMYAAPAFLFGTTLWLCVRSRKSYDDFSTWTAPLLCGIFAVLIHNLIDFAIFEPGIMTAFWAALAVIISQSLNSQTVEIKNPSRLKTTALVVFAAALAAALLWFYIIPVGKTAVKMENAKTISSYGRLREASAILDSAITDDRFNPAPPTLKGMMSLYNFKVDPSLNQDILLQSEKAFQAAIQRDPANFKNYENLAEVYQKLAEVSPPQHLLWFEKAFESLSHAVSLYPASADLHLTLATAAQQINKIDIAIDNYAQAIAIEDAYREQFKIMYPGKEVFSRIGEVNYKFAKERLEQLTRNEENKD
ncbi:MAG: O-antigen ligase family protein [Phycisphaerae bacterium]|jgi:hypothetical protein